MKKLITFLLLFIATSSALAAKTYRVVYEQDGLNYVFVDILADSNVMTMVMKEPIYKRILREVCGANDCTVKYWLNDSLVPNTLDPTPEQQSAMVAEYRQENGMPIRVSHKVLDKQAVEITQATCIKEVFNQFCLGGTVADLPAHDRKEIVGDIDRRYYFDSDMTAVFAFNGKIAEVRRIYSDMSWLKFNSTESKISDLYGKAQDLSQYPRYADDQMSRATAIRLEKAQVVKMWDLGTWGIRWSWFGDDGMLIYSHDVLSRAMKDADPGEGF